MWDDGNFASYAPEICKHANLQLALRRVLVGDSTLWQEQAVWQSSSFVPDSLLLVGAASILIIGCRCVAVQHRPVFNDCGAYAQRLRKVSNEDAIPENIWVLLEHGVDLVLIVGFEVHTALRSLWEELCTGPKLQVPRN
jgi:hypothetical protein